MSLDLHNKVDTPMSIAEAVAQNLIWCRVMGCDDVYARWIRWINHHDRLYKKREARS